MQKLLLILSVALLASCTTMGTMTNVKVQPPESDCVYLTNVDELIRGYTVNDKSEFNVDGEYQGVGLGVGRKKDGDFYRTQAKLSQQASTIRAVVSGVVIMNNHSCERQNIGKSWQAMNLLIKELGKTYRPAIANYDMNDALNAQIDAEIAEVEREKAMHKANERKAIVKGVRDTAIEGIKAYIGLGDEDEDEDEEGEGEEEFHEEPE